MRVLSRSPEETKHIGFKLGRLLRAGSTVCLEGDLGSGKTTLIKGIARALGIDEKEIMSASFIIISEHKGAKAPGGAPVLYHMDLYRVEKGSDFDELGIYEHIGGEGIAVVEWAEKIEVDDCIRVKINFLSEREREIIIEGADEKDWNNM